MFRKKLNKFIVTATTISAFMLPGINSAIAGSYCEGEYSKEIYKVKATYMPALQDLQKEIKRIQDAGLDPSKYVVDFEGEFVPITYKYGVLFNRYQTGAAHAAGSAEGCMDSVAPAQLAADLGVILGTGGLSLILPERMTRIDMGEVLNGKPFGDDSAAIPKFRDDAFKVIGVDPESPGTIGNIIKDPWKCVTFQRRC
ncbi:hypothetical protein A9Q90_03790 [Gammaproteobacteria bacterium 54_18_T64]|nr:hypothetical protein A9Q90_03790 [Gammaproteobacteria bacterium 54_18_T64]